MAGFERDRFASALQYREVSQDSDTDSNMRNNHLTLPENSNRIDTQITENFDNFFERHDGDKPKISILKLNREVKDVTKTYTDVFSPSRSHGKSLFYNDELIKDMCKFLDHQSQSSSINLSKTVTKQIKNFNYLPQLSDEKIIKSLTEFNKDIDEKSSQWYRLDDMNNKCTAWMIHGRKETESKHKKN